MRVEYTLPAIQPDAPPEIESAGEETANRSFRDQLRTSAVQIPESWEHQLGLDAPSFTSTYVGPPPRSAINLGDAESERARWQQLLWRHGDLLDPGASNSASQPVQAMLAMLFNMQDAEDEVVSQQVAVARG